MTDASGKASDQRSFWSVFASFHVTICSKSQFGRSCLASPKPGVGSRTDADATSIPIDFPFPTAIGHDRFPEGEVEIW